MEELNKEYNDLKIDENIKIINRTFYVIIGSLINVFISDLDKILSEIKSQESLKNLLDNLNNSYYTLLKINNLLNLSSKEIHRFNETINVLSILSFNDCDEEIKKNKNLMLEFIQKEIINEKGEENNFIDKIKTPNLKNNNQNGEKENIKEIEYTEKEKILINHLNNFYNYYKGKNNINFSEKFSSVLFDEYNKEFNERYRQYILKKILDDENLIQYNILLIKIILFQIIKPVKKYIDYALNCISNDEIYLPLLNDSKKDTVYNTIIKIFDITINLYFNSLENLEDHITNNLFKLFKEYLKVISDKEYKYYYNKYFNETLVKIYVLCFIKIYLNNFATLLLSDKKSALKEKEKIILEIDGNYSISNTIKIYFIILLYNKNNKSLNILEGDELYKPLKKYKSLIGKDDFDNILKNGFIPKEDKFLFNGYFTYIKYPSLKNFKDKLKESKEKYPLINEYIKNDKGPKNLKYLKDYNDFLNLMITHYSGNISRNETDRYIDSEDIYNKNENNFRDKLKNFINIYNTILSDYIREINEKELKKSEKYKKKFAGNEKLAYFLCDDNEKYYGIFVAKGYDKFIEWQNSFLRPVIKYYKSEKNKLLSCYVSQMEKEINIQYASDIQILQIEECFSNTNYNNFIEIVSLYSKRKNEDINDFEYDFEKIEEELGECLLPNKCLFKEKNINENYLNYICYQNEEFRKVNFDNLINFGYNYGEKELTEEERKKIFDYSNKEYNNFEFLFDSFILLVNYLNNNISTEKDTKVKDFINQVKEKYIKFNIFFISYFEEEGKEIVIEKLLKSFLYMEQMCFEHLINSIDLNYKSTFEPSEEKELIEYFNSKHKDIIITKNEIASAVRRFITRYLLNNNKKENVDSNLSLYICLERKYLWDNKIFSSIGNNFKDLIKQYLGSFSFDLKVRHSFEFYNLIGDEDTNFINEEKVKFKVQEPETILNNKEPNSDKEDNSSNFTKPKMKE